jgi:hypothetical protein
MPLISCPECNEEVSDSALKCTKCGYQLRKAKRGVVGKIIKWSFIGFNILMIIWLISGMGTATEGFDTMTEAEQLGTAIGAGIGLWMIISIWVLGDIILGLFVLFTRPKS